MTDDEYTIRFLELLRYVPYLTEEKVKIKRFISGLLVAFKGRIEFDEPRSLEEAIRNLRHCYEQLKYITESKSDLTGDIKNKDKWDKKRARPQGIDNNEDVAPPKKFIASNRGQGYQTEE